MILSTLKALRALQEMSDEQITAYVERFKQGDSLAAQQIFAYYEPQLLRHAQRRSSGRLRVTDEEDIVVMAFQSFFRGVRESKFEQVENRDDLWQLLSMLATRKAIDSWQHEQRQKRGGGQLVGESAITPNEGGGGMPSHPSDEAPPDLSVQMMEEVEKLLDSLDSESLREIALCKLAGYSNQEIADRIGSGLRTVERKLKLIRSIWREWEEQV